MHDCCLQGVLWTKWSSWSHSLDLVARHISRDCNFTVRFISILMLAIASMTVATSGADSYSSLASEITTVFYWGQSLIFSVVFCDFYCVFSSSFVLFLPWHADYFFDLWVCLNHLDIFCPFCIGPVNLFSKQKLLEICNCWHVNS